MYNNINEIPQEKQDFADELHKGIYKTEGKELCMNCTYARRMYYEEGEKMIRLKHCLLCLREQRMTPEVYSCKDFQKTIFNDDLPF